MSKQVLYLLGSSLIYRELPVFALHLSCESCSETRFTDLYLSLLKQLFQTVHHWILNFIAKI